MHLKIEPKPALNMSQYQMICVGFFLFSFLKNHKQKGITYVYYVSVFFISIVVLFHLETVIYLNNRWVKQPFTGPKPLGTKVPVISIGELIMHSGHRFCLTEM